MSDEPVQSQSGDRVAATPRPAAEPVRLAPRNVDGVGEFGLGTVAFAVVTAVFLIGRESLGVPLWWLQVAVAGLVIGVVATAYCLWRRNKRQQDAARGIMPPTV